MLYIANNQVGTRRRRMLSDKYPDDHHAMTMIVLAYLSSGARLPKNSLNIYLLLVYLDLTLGCIAIIACNKLEIELENNLPPLWMEIYDGP